MDSLSSMQEDLPPDERKVNGNTFGRDATINQINNYGNLGSGGRRAVHAIPFTRNEGYVIRQDIAKRLEEVLPGAGRGRSAALWGLGGSGFVLPATALCGDDDMEITDR